MSGARKRVGYSVGAGGARTLRFKLTKRSFKKLRKRRSLRVTVLASNRDAGGSVETRRAFTVRR
jgi:hypothetical protein